MGRVLAIDYGQKRVGLAVTDNLQIIANALTTVHSKDVISYIESYCAQHEVDVFVIGEPKQMNNLPSQSAPFIAVFIKKLKNKFPEKKIVRIDERYTSKMAFQTMIDAGLKKSDRRNKELVDTISAVLILQTYLEMKHNENLSL